MKKSGYTLIEMLMTVGILGILVLVASSLYTSYVRKGRRIDAVNSILSIQLAEEQYRSKNTQYGTLAQVWSGVSASAEGYYSIAISNVTASSYTITATAQGTQANDAENGTSCSALTLAMSNGTITKTPAACWPT